MTTKLYPFKADCDKAGVIIHLHARSIEDAYDRLTSHPGYLQAQRKHKTNKSDWIISKEE